MYNAQAGDCASSPPRKCSCETSHLIPICHVLRRNTFACRNLQYTDLSCVAWLLVMVHAECGGPRCLVQPWEVKRV